MYFTQTRSRLCNPEPLIMELDVEPASTLCANLKPAHSPSGLIDAHRHASSHMTCQSLRASIATHSIVGVDGFTCRAAASLQ